MKNWKLLSTIFQIMFVLLVLFCFYYLIAMLISILIFVIEIFQFINRLYKLLFMSEINLMFTLYHIISLSISVLSRLCFISWSSPPPLLLNWPCVQLYLEVLNQIYTLKRHIVYCWIHFAKIYMKIPSPNWHFLTFLLFSLKNNVTSRQGKQEN